MIWILLWTCLALVCLLVSMKMRNLLKPKKMPIQLKTVREELNIEVREPKNLLQTDKTQWSVQEFPNFLTHEQCDTLIQLAKPLLFPSEVVGSEKN